jgi:large-conductance mechanosensitive channel
MKILRIIFLFFLALIPSLYVGFGMYVFSTFSLASIIIYNKFFTIIIIPLIIFLILFSLLIINEKLIRKEKKVLEDSKNKIPDNPKDEKPH